MSTAIFVLMMANLAYIGLLPAVFFRRDGKLNYRWWLTAAPLFLSAALAALHYFGLMAPRYPAGLGAIAEAAATLLSAVSVALISYTLGTHRRRLALWHQQNDRPEHIVTEGAYKHIRHPFYAAFIATLLANAVLCASPLALAISVAGILILNYTAAREERRLQESEFGEEYRAYMRRSGRFLPHWHGPAL